MRTKLLAFKNELKELATQIRVKKSQRCAANNGYVHNLFWDSREYRIRHVAYCLARGRTLEQIESKNHPGNELTDYDMKKIQTIIESLKEVEVI